MQNTQVIPGVTLSNVSFFKLMRSLRIVVAFSIASAFVATNQGRAFADAAQFAPQAIVHAVELQTEGTFANMTLFTEPCTSAGLSDAVNRADAAFENKDGTEWLTEQVAFSVGFARCALNATSAEDFATFAAASVQAGLHSVSLHVTSKATTSPADIAKLHQFQTICNWLLNDAAASPTDKTIAQRALEEINGFGGKMATTAPRTTSATAASASSAASGSALKAGRQYLLRLEPSYTIASQRCGSPVQGWAMCLYSDENSAVTIITHVVHGAWNGVGKYGGAASAAMLQQMYGVPASVAQKLAACGTGQC